MKLVGTGILQTALALSLGFVGIGSAQSVPASPLWGNAEVREITQYRNCTVYGLVTDPEHTFWVVCSPGSAPGTPALPAAATGH